MDDIAAVIAWIGKMSSALNKNKHMNTMMKLTDEISK